MQLGQSPDGQFFPQELAEARTIKDRTKIMVIVGIIFGRFLFRKLFII
jgi:hypothetical protein